MRNILILVILICLICSCRKTLCNMYRYDWGPAYNATKPGDTFTMVVWITPNPYAPTLPKLVVDSMNKLSSNGYQLVPVAPYFFKYADCEKCSLVSSYSSYNKCYENK